MYSLILVIILGLIFLYMYIKTFGTIYKSGKKLNFTKINNKITHARYKLLVSAQCSPYQDWQSVALYYSMQKNWPTATLTRLTSCNNLNYKYKNIVPSITVSDWATHPITGDKYPPYNRPLALTEYVQKGYNKMDQYLVIIDPDTIILKSMESLPVCKGKPIAQFYNYLNNNDALNTIAKKYCNLEQLKNIQAIGMPMIIHTSDLELLAPLWLNLTVKIRSDFKELAGWIAEMHSYCIASAILGLKHSVYNNLSSRPDYTRIDEPFILHYDLKHSCLGFEWDKADYSVKDMLSGQELMPEPRYPPNELFLKVFKTINESLLL